MKTMNFKKITAKILLVSVTVLTLAGCGSSSTDTDTSETGEAEAAEDAQAEADTQADTDTQTETDALPAEEETPVPTEVDVDHLSEDQQNMLAPMDCFSAAADTFEPYEDLDQSTVWEALYLIIVNYTDTFSRKVTRDLNSNELVVPESVLIDCAYAMFDGFDGTLPQNGYGENINREDDTYYFMDSDRGDSYTRISAWTDEGDGTCTVETQILSESDQELYAAYQFTLGPNPGNEDESSPLFIYTVTGMEKLDE